MALKVHVGFSLPSEKDIGPRIVSHFSGLGYRLADERADQWVFRRRNKLAALWRFNIAQWPEAGRSKMRARLLQLTLIVVGAMFCLSAPMLVLPASYWKAAASWFIGAETVEALWPIEPLFDYALRASMVAYLWIGVVLLLAATDPEKYKSQVDVAIAGLLVLAVVCVAAGWLNGIPVWWYLGDAVPCFLGAILLLLFRPRRPAS